MEIAEKFSLTNYGIDTVLFDQMVGTLDFDEQHLLNEALETVPTERRAFIAKSIKPYLRGYAASVQTERDTAMVKHARIGKNALYHAIALTHISSDFPLMELTAPQSETLLSRVFDMVFFYPMGVTEAFHRDVRFVDTVCGAGYYVLAGDRSIYRRDALELRGRNARLLEEHEMSQGDTVLAAA